MRRSMSRSGRRPLGELLIVASLVLSSLAGRPALHAQEEVAQEDRPAAEESSTRPKITLHGYLTQAYAQSDGHQILGITEDGTFDYRTAALQIRAEMSASDVFVVQLSHERLGESAVQDLADDVELDWVFYEHRFESSSVKVGRVQIPFGVYNEVKDVGTLLPFYRPSHNFYGEAAYSSETIDGIVASRAFDLGRGWGLDADLYYGGLQFIERNLQGAYAIDQVDDAVGAEIWLDTPVPGLRMGTGAMQYEIDPSTAGESTWRACHVSVSGEFDRFAVHAEFKSVDIEIGDVYLGYLHLGYNLTDRLTLNAQRDDFDFKLSGFPRAHIDEDDALGVSFAWQPNVLLKAEHHWNEGNFWLEDIPQFGAPVQKTRYWILSLSTSF